MKPKIVWSEITPFIPVTKKRFISPIFEHICLNLIDKALQLTDLCLVLNTSMVAFMSKYCKCAVYQQNFADMVVSLATSHNSSVDF